VADINSIGKATSLSTTQSAKASFWWSTNTKASSDAIFCNQTKRTQKVKLMDIKNGITHAKTNELQKYILLPSKST
jgi:hypothetical protein